ncbi:MAG: hypothetical protein VX777_06790, partial [Chlamydiota bacterium]|nr:hypothetical protein [Chlamydiota bacterium]
MTTILQEFQELLSMTQSHIFNEYNSKDLLMTDPETHVFYQQFYQGLGKTQPKPIQPQPPQRIASPPTKQSTPPPPKGPTTPAPPARQPRPPH